MTSTAEEARPTADPAELTLSVFEIDHLSALLGLPVPATAARTAADLNADAKTPPHVVHADLSARGLVGRDKTGILVDEGVTEVLTFIAQPGLIARIERLHSEDSGVQTIYAMPDRALLESTRGPACLTYSDFDPATILPFIAHAAGLDDQRAEPKAEADPTKPDDAEATVELTVSMAVASAAGTLISLGNVNEATTRLVEAGAAPSVAQRLTEALATQHRGSYSVVLTHRAGGILTDTLIAWSDCGPAGHWQVQQDDATRWWSGERLMDPAAVQESLAAPVTIHLTSPERLMAQIITGLPSTPLQ